MLFLAEIPLPRTKQIRLRDSLYGDILTSLRFRCILMSRDPDKGPQMPFRLRFVPHRFRLRGDALFDSASNRQRHLSFHYDHVHKYLDQIGLSTMTLDNLLDEFVQWIKAHGVSGLKAKSAQWHSKIATLFCDEKSLKDRLAALQIIPLRDGSWVNAVYPRLYLLRIGTMTMYLGG